MYKVNPQNKSLNPLDQVKFSDIGIKERADIQEWLASTPQIFGVEQDSLLILNKELPVSGKDDRGIRLDLLALDRRGKIVVIELKRDEARGDVDWQSIKYAARCSKFTPSDVIQLLSNYDGCSEECAKDKIIEHIEGESVELTEDNFDKLFEYSTNHSGLETRIILVAREFHPDICASVDWLRHFGIDISCIKLKPYKDQEGDVLYLTSERILPLPDLSDYTEFKKLPLQNKSANNNDDISRTKYSNIVSDLGSEELKNSLKLTLSRENSNLTPRLVEFLKILADGKEHDREKIKEELKDNNLFGGQSDLGQTGRLLSNISQFITKPASGHLRQLIEFSGQDNLFQAGQKKTSYRIRKEYVDLLKTVLSEINSKVKLVQ